MTQHKQRLNVKEAAALIGCSTVRVRQWLAEGKLKGRKFTERAWEIDRKSAEEMRDNPAKTGRPRGS